MVGMVGRMRDFLRAWVLLSVACTVACVTGQSLESTPTTSSSSSSSSSGSGTGGGDAGPCGVDCSKFETPPCTVAVCNIGQVLNATLNACAVVPAADGTACDDGQFCTTADACAAGVCVGGAQNDCGIAPTPCMAIICYEDSKSCGVTPVDDGTTCTPTDLCEVSGVCQVGECQGMPKDCSFSPLNECNTVSCDSTTGKCTGTPDPNKDDSPCVLSGDLCSVDKTCLAGVCGGGKPMDCSALDVGCQAGACDEATGFCGPVNAAIGTACSQGVPVCYVGACDVKGNCVPSQGPDGATCNDHDSCTQGDTCAAGVCAGTPVSGCVLYFTEDWGTCPDGWTLGGDWQCGAPTGTSPVTPFTGKNVLATQLDGLYNNNDTFATCTADSPPIDLTVATNPELSFWVWDNTEGGTFDGWNLKVSIDGGQTYTEVMTVTPPYSLMIAGQAAWGGNYSAEGWQNYFADLTAYKGQKINLQFGFRSDPATVFPGVYIDDIVVAEPLQIPLYVTTTSPLPDAYAGTPYSTTILSTGATSSAVWSIDPGGVNTSWLTINAMTGVLSGTPSQAEAGTVSVTVRIEEPGFPTNFAEQTLTFIVAPDLYYTSFEGACPDGWTLTGDWHCGVPTNPAGPTAAYDGTQCISTGLTSDYSNLDTWAGTTATSPQIELTGGPSPTLTFWMWIDTEGSVYDGANLQISTDGGMTYSVVDTVMPAYPLTIAGERAWGGHLGALGWQLVQVDLSAYAGLFVYLRFGFQSDASDTFAGVYIDDFLVE
jgi:Immune inhibitor A peptidase M6/Putative Ig domain